MIYNKYIKSTYSNLAKLTLQDLRNNKKESVFFSKYTKEEIVKYLTKPESYQKQLRTACQFLYSTSNHFRRLVDYFGKMALFYYIIIPYKIGDSGINKKMYKNAFIKVADRLNKFNIPHEFQKIMTVCFREDVFFGYIYETEDSFFIRQIPSDACIITTVEDSVYNYSVDFNYFQTRESQLASYGDEFVEKYNLYKNSKGSDPSLRYQEIDSRKSICIKINEDNPTVAIPPFAGVLESLFELVDYKSLVLANTELQNTKLISFKIETNKDTGEPMLDDVMRQKFYSEIGDQMPMRVGYVITPFSAESFSFANTANTMMNQVANAEEEYFNSAGVSSMLFNGNRASSAALIQSIKTDFDIVKSVLRQIERWINRLLKTDSDSKYKFKISILDVTSFNIDEVYKRAKESATYGTPVKSILAALNGYNPSDLINMGYLENDILELRDTVFSEPLLSSNTLSSESTNEGGRPQSDEPLSDSGQTTRDKGTAADRI